METFLQVARSLSRKGIAVHVATSEDGLHGVRSRHVSHVHRVPPHACDPEGWVTAIGQLAAALDVTMILPCDDSSLRLLDTFRPRLTAVRIAIPDTRAVALLADKGATREAALALGIPVARGEAIANLADAGRAEVRLGFPLVVKPQESFALGDAAGKTMARILRTPQDMIAFVPLIGARGWIAEEFVPGTGKCVSVLACEGEILFAWQHRRIATATETGASAIRIGEPVDPTLLRDVRLLARDAGLHGVAMFEFRVDETARRHVLIEVNPRFWGSLATAGAAGVDFPGMLWELLTGRPVTLPQACLSYRMRYHLDGEYRRRVGAFDAAAGWTAKIAALMGIAALVARLFVTKRVFDTYAADDPAPFRSERRAVLGALLRGIGARLTGR